MKELGKYIVADPLSATVSRRFAAPGFWLLQSSSRSERLVSRAHPRELARSDHAEAVKEAVLLARDSFVEHQAASAAA